MIDPASGRIKPALSRGDDELKIDNTPQAIVVSVGIVATAGLVGFLVASGWPASQIIAFATLAAGLFAGQWAAGRKSSVIDAKQDHQTEKLDRVVRQTNGAMHAAISEAVETGIARGVAAIRDQETRHG